MYLKTTIQYGHLRNFEPSRELVKGGAEPPQGVRAQDMEKGSIVAGKPVRMLRQWVLAGVRQTIRVTNGNGHL